MDERDKTYIIEQVTKHLKQTMYNCEVVVDFLRIDAPINYHLRLLCAIGSLKLCREMLDGIKED